MLLFCLLWILWCVMHSLLITPVVVRKSQDILPWIERYYRLLYNFFSGITLVPLIIWLHFGGQSGEILFFWHGPLIVIRILFFVISICLFCAGSRHYDLQSFLGLSQLRDGQHHLLGTAATFSTEGILGITRHPWYLGSFLFVWSVFSWYDERRLAVAFIFSAYLIIGSWLEERKLLARYPEAYAEYCRQVPMFLPKFNACRRFFALLFRIR